MYEVNLKQNKLTVTAPSVQQSVTIGVTVGRTVWWNSCTNPPVIDASPTSATVHRPDLLPTMLHIIISSSWCCIFL